MRFRNEGNSEDLLVFNNTTKIVDRDSLKKALQPKWVEHSIPNKTGNIVHFTGTGNAGIPFIIWFKGDARNTDYKTVRDLATAGTIIWLDADDFDTNLNGKYYIHSCKRDNMPGFGIVKGLLTLREYNN